MLLSLWFSLITFSCLSAVNVAFVPSEHVTKATAALRARSLFHKVSNDSSNIRYDSLFELQSQLQRGLLNRSLLESDDNRDGRRMGSTAESSSARDTCAALKLDSEECEQECNLYSDWLFLLENLAYNYSTYAKYIRMHQMSSGPLSWQYAGVFDECKYVGGRYCSTPALYDDDYIVLIHGCCIPESCKGDDAIKVVNSSLFCYQVFEAYASAVLQFDPHSNSTDDSDYSISIVCDFPERDWTDAGLIFILCWICLFTGFVLIASVVRARQFDLYSARFGHELYELLYEHQKNFRKQKRADSLIDDLDDDLDGDNDSDLLLNGECQQIELVKFLLSKDTPVGYIPKQPLPPQTKKDANHLARLRRQELTRIEAGLISDMINQNTWDNINEIFVNVFCIQESWKSLIKLRDKDTDEFPFLDCIRVMSTGWVALGHAYFWVLYMYTDNLQTIYPMNESAPSHGSFTYDINHIYTNFAFQAFFSVDSFFWLSGFLATKSLLKIWPKFGWNHSPLFVIFCYISRYLRFLPMVLFIMAFQWKLLDQVPSGPFVLNRHLNDEYCNEDWTKVVFFYGNLQGNGTMNCMSHLWYLQCDIQMYLTVPFAIMLYSYHRKSALFASLFMIVLCICVRTAISYYYHFPYTFLVYNSMQVRHNGDLFKVLYGKPWTRCGPYYAGMLLCLIFDYIHSVNNPGQQKNHHSSSDNPYQSKAGAAGVGSSSMGGSRSSGFPSYHQTHPLPPPSNSYLPGSMRANRNAGSMDSEGHSGLWPVLNPANVKSSKYRNFMLSLPMYYLLMGLGSAILLALFFGPYSDISEAPQHRWNDTSNIWMNGLGRPSWGIGLSLISFAMRFGEPLDPWFQSLGHRSLSKYLMSMPMWQILSKVTFTTYLLHWFIYAWFVADLEQGFHYTFWNVTFLWIGVWFGTMMISFVLWFVMERPMQAMVTLLLSLMLSEDGLFCWKRSSREANTIVIPSSNGLSSSQRDSSVKKISGGERTSPGMVSAHQHGPPAMSLGQAQGRSLDRHDYVTDLSLVRHNQHQQYLARQIDEDEESYIK